MILGAIIGLKLAHIFVKTALVGASSLATLWAFTLNLAFAAVLIGSTLGLHFLTQLLVLRVT